MPIPAAALAGAIVPGVLNFASDMYANYRNRQFSEQMYQRQYDDAINFWNMQNAYNTPEEQMKRFSAAGLNPNLIYGQAGDNSAGNIPVPDVQPANIRAPRFDRMDVIAPLLASADLKIKNAQANNLQVQTDILRQDAILRGFQAETAGFDLGFKRDLRDVSADALRESVRQKRVSSDLAINADARAAIMNASSVSEAAERIKNMIEQRKGFVLQRGQTVAETKRIAQDIENMQKDGRIKDFEIMLNKANVSKSDPLWSRIIADFISGNGSILKPLKSLPPEIKGFPGPKY